jgi:LmeA-like phospholipid-binding
VSSERSGRGWVTLLVVVLLVVGGLVLADRIAARVAAHEMSKRLGEHQPFTAPPTVKIKGFPFFTQALRGVYSDIAVSGNQVSVATQSGERISDLSFSANLRGAHLRLADALGGQVAEVPVDKIDGKLTVPFDQLDKLADKNVTFGHVGSDMLVTGSVTLPVVGKVTGNAVGTFTFVDGRLVVHLTSARLIGVPLPANLVQNVINGLTPRLDLPTLPYKLRVTDVRASDAGVTFYGEADDVVLITS